VGLWAGVVCSSPGHRLTFSEILGESRARRKIRGVIRRKFREIPGILHHQTASFAGAPEKRRDFCHVTQPRARVNVSCSRAGQKGRGTTKRGPAKDSEKWVPGQQMVGTRPGYQTRVPDLGTKLLMKSLSQSAKSENAPRHKIYFSPTAVT
jgi:hypothetical protein